MYRLEIDTSNTRQLRNAITSYVDKTLVIQVQIKIISRLGKKTKMLNTTDCDINHDETTRL